jgi:hypothetical protein
LKISHFSDNLGGIMKQYRDEIAMICHNMMKAGQSIGAVTSEEIRQFEENCFTPVPENIQSTEPEKQEVSPA